MGCVGGLIIGLVTEYFTSHSFVPTRELASACKFGTAVNIIQGLALGYKSCIIPVFVLSSAIFVSFQLCDLRRRSMHAMPLNAKNESRMRQMNHFKSFKSCKLHLNFI